MYILLCFRLVVLGKCRTEESDGMLNLEFTLRSGYQIPDTFRPRTVPVSGCRDDGTGKSSRVSLCIFGGGSSFEGYWNHTTSRGVSEGRSPGFGKVKALKSWLFLSLDMDFSI
jgi:hypothetical protein